MRGVITIRELGWDDHLAAQLGELDPEGALQPARVSADGGDRYELAGCDAHHGELAGRLRPELGPAERPVTGDWVAVEPGSDPARIVQVLDRRTVLRRRAAGSESRAQLLAANVDVFLVVTSANRDFSPRRLERYLAAIWDGGASPVVVLNKIDLVDDPDPWRERIEAVAPGVRVLELSAHSGAGMQALTGLLGPGRTFGFVGSSGVGKSTLINSILGGEGARHAYPPRRRARSAHHDPPTDGGGAGSRRADRHSRHA